MDIALEDENDIVEVTAPENVPEEEPLQGFFEGNASGGHAFNVIVYKNKYRIMDYYEIDKYFNSNNKWSKEHHRPSNVWNDENGTYNALPWHNKDWINPAKVIQNRVLGQKCYEPGKTYWSSKTLYEDVCP